MRRRVGTWWWREVQERLERVGFILQTQKFLKYRTFLYSGTTSSEKNVWMSSWVAFLTKKIKIFTHKQKWSTYLVKSKLSTSRFSWHGLQTLNLFLRMKMNFSSKNQRTFSFERKIDFRLSFPQAWHCFRFLLVSTLYNILAQEKWIFNSKNRNFYYEFSSRVLKTYLQNYD